MTQRGFKYASRTWRRMREAVLKANLLCACGKDAVTVGHRIIPTLSDQNP
jgi:hypothetical protein